MGEWEEESVVNKAEAIAHWIHRNLRESYTWEKRTAEQKKAHSPIPAKATYENVMRGMGIR
jgi:hypothetical protein